MFRSAYYQSALRAIEKYHEAGNDKSIVNRAILELEQRLNAVTTSQTRTQLRGNITAIEAYMRSFGGRRFRVIKKVRWSYEIAGLVVTARPDLWISEDGVQYLIKIGVARHKLSYIELILSLLRKATVKNGCKVRANNILLFKY